jgi:hypothetical protein
VANIGALVLVTMIQPDSITSSVIAPVILGQSVGVTTDNQAYTLSKIN